MSVEILDMFKKSSVSQETSFISLQSQKTTSCSDMDQFLSFAENLDCKLCSLKEDFEQAVKCLRAENSELKSLLWNQSWQHLRKLQIEFGKIKREV